MQLRTAANLPLQIAVALALMAGIAALTVWLTKRGQKAHDGSAKDVFLAAKSLNWPFVAGSITLTNLSTEQLVGMNGNQMFLLAWWELSGFAGLLIVDLVFVPIYYRQNCITLTQMDDLSAFQCLADNRLGIVPRYCAVEGLPR